MLIVIALLAFNVEQTIVIETFQRQEVIGTAWQTVALVIYAKLKTYYQN